MKIITPASTIAAIILNIATAAFLLHIIRSSPLSMTKLYMELFLYMLQGLPLCINVLVLYRKWKK